MDYDIVPNSEFVISRTAFKDNTSYYELNKKKVQFKEIAKILRSYGVDLDHNRFLILQVCNSPFADYFLAIISLYTVVHRSTISIPI